MTDNVSVVPDNVNEPYKVVWIPPVVETEEVVEDVIHVSGEVMPEFPGGAAELLKYLSTHIKYPTMSQGNRLTRTRNCSVCRRQRRIDY